MKLLKLLSGVAMLLLISTTATAGDFDWMKDMSAQASLDPSGFRARLAARFQIGDAKISAVLSNMPDPADAYMALRFGEMSRQPIEKVMEEYNKNKGKGWGVMAKNLGIKSGSAEFHALKGGHDLDGGKTKAQAKTKEKAGGAGKPKEKQSDKNTGKGKK